VGTPAGPPPSAVAPAPPSPASLPVAALSYSAIAEYGRCGYRFYAERVLGLPATPVESTGATARGTEIHELLRELDFSEPHPDPPIAAFLAGETAARLARAAHVRREQPFVFEHDGALIRGTFDVIATEGDGALVVDYKTGGYGAYDTQRLIYALAALRSGVANVEVAYVFLDVPERSRSDRYTEADLPALERALSAATAGLRAGRFTVSAEPQRSLCAGCPALGGLCSWPAEVALRPAADRLF
jgi:ATP-dependent helicase/nuclease subunit A